MPLRGSGLRLVAVFLCGTVAFLNLYCTQPMLPMLSHVFGVTEAQVGITVSAATIGVAITSFLLALYGERLPRKRFIVSSMVVLSLVTLLASTAQSLTMLAIGRFFQGLSTPGIFILTIAYITDEFPPMEIPKVMSSYVAGTVFGGFVGRFLGGMIAQRYGWHMVFVALALLGLLGAAVTSTLLPQARHRHSQRVHSVWTPILKNLRSVRLLATFLIGFCMLFTLVSTFNFVTFYLSAAPFGLSTEKLSDLFAVYLFGLLATLIVGRFLARIGLRNGMMLATALGVIGITTTLSHSLVLVAVGLSLASSCVFIAQTSANSFMRDAAPTGARVSATGMYICIYYLGGTVGGMLPGVAWKHYGWPGCVALIASMIVLAAVTAFFGWKAPKQQRDPLPV
ncbi:MFS transporter [Granulicella cerasi]|uniref:MFS transporter n=1 Tax=Granulicella cerasi TaxID=741063 RepID=A0ABW1Z9X3_9BACT|nr:MFS transporter [Granulicella cerasi]